MLRKVAQLFASVVMTHNEFNPFTGRLKESTRFQPLYPLNPSVLNTSEQKVIWDNMNTKPSEVEPQAAGKTALNPKLLKNYQFFQRDVNIPVYRAAGTRDRLLYAFTLMLTAVGLIDVGKTMYDLTKKY